MTVNPRRRARLAPALIFALVVVLISACDDAQPTATPSPSPVAVATPTATPAPPTVTPTPTASPTPPPFSLELPEERSAATIEFSVTPDVPPEGAGELVVSVTNTSEEVIDEIVLRWPTAIREVLFLAPFEPGPDRMVNPLVVPWTSWVEGPGTRGEPAGTTSLGWGPLDPGVTLEIPILATRRAEGALEFDLQFLEGVPDEGQVLLLTDDGEPAVTRVVIEP